MGNSKSRLSGGTHPKTRSRHSRFQSSGSNTDQPLPNDSGHYSDHGVMVSSSPFDHAGSPLGPSGLAHGAMGSAAGLAWNHPNLSSPGRLDQQKKTSESSLHFKYGSRAQNPGYAAATGPINGDSAAFRTSGVASRATGTMGYGSVEDSITYGYSNNSAVHTNQEMVMAMHHHQPQPSYQGPDTRPSSASPHQSYGRVSSLTPVQQQQHQQHPVRASISPTTVPYIEEDPVNGKIVGGGLSGMVSSVAAMNLGNGAIDVRTNGGNAQQQQAMRFHQQPDYLDHQRLQSFQNNTTTVGNRNSAIISHSVLSGAVPHSSAPRMDPFKNSNSQHYHYDTVPVYVPPEQPQYQLQQQQPYQVSQPRITTTYPTEREQRTAPPAHYSKPVDLLAGAGPLIETGKSSQRMPGADQVFARLARQFPTNPRETEKREQIYRWLDRVADALAFSPSTETPGWVIPVYPDELDHAESPFYLDRITYELDLMAPAGKSFRKAIDINCNTGEWAMDMALKYPRTVVYAIDSLLETTHLPLRTPDNCKFRMRDVRDQEGEFDLVHQRLGAFRTQIQEWTPHFAELRRLTRPGGWIQLAESNGLIVCEGIESLKMNRWVERAALSSGLNPMQMVEALMPTVLGAGLINVECFDYGIPLGDWAGPRGQLAMRTYLEMVESLKEEIVDVNHLEEGIFEETIELMKMECIVGKAELIMKVIYAQKPPITDDLWRTRGMII
ncbi:hypothetical protein BGZ98_008911 [Dissophora globulifera]|nr:hypothetical protein BGZ98_008911 [Dissophora globulifera]